MPQPPRLSAFALTLALAATIVSTLGILGIYAWKFGRAREKSLPVTVEIGQFPVPTLDGGVAVLAPAIRLRNQSDAPIPNLAITVNKDFHLYRDSPMPEQGELVLPLEIFKTKSNQTFRPQSMEVRKITVYGQLPSHARGVIDYIPEEQGEKPKE
jgi:hypothetical protein